MFRGLGGGTMLYNLESKPAPESNVPSKVSSLLQCILMGTYVNETPFLKLSPRAYYPDYTVLLNHAPSILGFDFCPHIPSP